MIQLNLKPLFALRGVDKPYQFLLHAGFSHHVASNLVAGKMKSLSLEQLERLCHCLLCEPNELLVWQVANINNYPPNYPLRKLLSKENLISLKEELKGLNYTELREITQDFAGKIKQIKAK